MRKRKSGVGFTAASGLVFDPGIRSAALRATPPLARLGWGVGKRMARRRAQHRWEQLNAGFGTAATLLVRYGPQIATQLGFVEPPRKRSRLAPKLALGALAGAGAYYLLEPQHGAEHRQQVQRLIVH